MYGVGAYHVPECGSAHFQASIQVSGSAFVVSTGFTPFTFWGYDIKLYLRAEVWNAYNVNEYYSSDSVLAEQHSFWWWTTAVPGTLWSWGGSTYPVVVNGYFCGYYSFMARFNVIQDVRVSGAGIVVAGDEVYSYLSSATFWRL